jgi:ADP-L-glycero-D-manno-heptose 6-epimerase
MASTPFHFNNQIIEKGICRVFGATDGYGAGEHKRDFVMWRM